MKKFSITFAVCFSALLVLSACQDTQSPNVMQSKDCWVDGINGNTSLVVPSKPSGLDFTGWAGDSTVEKSPRRVSIQIIGSKGAVVVSASSDSMIARPDVAQASGKPEYDMTGFKISVDGTKLAKGEYAISIAIYREGAALFCPTIKKLVIQ